MAINAGPKIVEDGLVLCLDAANRRSYPRTGTVWTDLTANKNNGTLTNMNGSNFSTDGGGSLTFDGTNENVQEAGSASNLLHELSSLTISFWANVSAYQANGTIAERFITSSSDATHPHSNWEIGLYNDNKNLVFRTDNEITEASNSSSISLNRWYNIVYLLSGGYGKFIVNNEELANQTNDAISIQMTKTWKIGGLATRNFNGKMAIVSFYNRALSASEVQQNYNATKWRFQ